MSAVIAANPPAGHPVPDPPIRPDGGLYAFSLCYDAGKWRAYADTAAELLDVLIPGYLEADDPQVRLELRLAYAVRCQVTLQAAVVASNPDLMQRCTPEQQELLLSSRATPPLAEDWSAPLPLFLVTSFHNPIGLTPRPTTSGVGEVLWIDPSTEHELLVSLHAAGMVSMAARDDAEGL